MTALDHIRAALEALLRDDIPERNRHCRLALEAIRRDEFCARRLLSLAPNDNLTTQ